MYRTFPQAKNVVVISICQVSITAVTNTSFPCRLSSFPGPPLPGPSMTGASCGAHPEDARRTVDEVSVRGGGPAAIRGKPARGVDGVDGSHRSLGVDARILMACIRCAFEILYAAWQDMQCRKNGPWRRRWTGMAHRRMTMSVCCEERVPSWAPMTMWWHTSTMVCLLPQLGHKYLLSCRFRRGMGPFMVNMVTKHMTTTSRVGVSG